MNILIFGNSITQGFNDTEYGGWANRLAIHTMRGDGENVVFNLGISGENIIGIEKRIVSEIEHRRGRHNNPIFLILAVGINDSLVDIQTGEHRTDISLYKETFEKIVKKIKPLVERIILVGLTQVDGSVDPVPWKPTHAYRNSEVEKYNHVIEEVAQQYNLTFISAHDLFSGDPSQYLSDGIHPNAEGHRLMYERVKGVLEKEGII